MDENHWIGEYIRTVNSINQTEKMKEDMLSPVDLLAVYMAITMLNKKLLNIEKNLPERIVTQLKEQLT